MVADEIIHEICRFVGMEKNIRQQGFDKAELMQLHSFLSMQDSKILFLETELTRVSLDSEAIANSIAHKVSEKLNAKGR